MPKKEQSEKYHTYVRTACGITCNHLNGLFYNLASAIHDAKQLNLSGYSVSIFKNKVPIKIFNSPIVATMLNVS